MNGTGTGTSPGMTNGRTLAWLRQTAEYPLTTTWSVPANSTGRPAHRDVVILDARNAFVDVYNLTAHSIDVGEEAYLAHRTELKAKLVAAATHRDTDGDRLSDAWELECYGNLTATPSTPAANGASALACYSSGQLPLAPNPLLAPRIGIDRVGENHLATFVYRRRLGRAGGLLCAPETTDGLAQWTAAAAQFVTEATENPYDGTGTEIVTLRAIDPLENVPNRWARLRFSLPPP